MFQRPKLYFRQRLNGAAVYRVLEDQNARLDMQQIAVLRPNGDVKSQGKQEPTDIELDEITSWHSERIAGDEKRQAARVDSLISEMNIVAQWVQSDANDTQVENAAQPIMLAMHDLRTTLVKRLGQR